MQSCTIVLFEKGNQNMSVKIKIFYENDRELEEIKKSLQNKIEQCKIPKNQTGKFKKAYIKINEK